MRWMWRGAAALAVGAAALGLLSDPIGDLFEAPGTVAERLPAAVEVAAEPHAEPHVGTPQAVAAHPTGRTGEIRVTWAAPADTDVVAYRIDVAGRPPLELDATETTTVLRGLTDEQVSEVEVTSVADDGESSASVPITSRSVATCSGATITWDGGASTTAWSDALNWDLDRVPTTTDHVCVPGGSVVVASAKPKVLSLTSAGALTLAAGLEVTETATPSLLSATQWTGGTLSGSMVVVTGGS